MVSTLLYLKFVLVLNDLVILVNSQNLKLWQYNWTFNEVSSVTKTCSLYPIFFIIGYMLTAKISLVILDDLLYLCLLNWGSAVFIFAYNFYHLIVLKVIYFSEIILRIAAFRIFGRWKARECGTFYSWSTKQEDTDRKACLSVTAQKNVNDLAAPASAAVTTTMTAAAVIKFMLLWNLSVPCKRSRFKDRRQCCNHVVTIVLYVIHKLTTCVAGVICHNWENSTWVLACGKTNFFSLCCGNKCPSIVSCTLMRVKFDGSHGVDGSHWPHVP